MLDKIPINLNKQILVESEKHRKYWRRLKKDNELATICSQLKMKLHKNRYVS